LAILGGALCAKIAGLGLLTVCIVHGNALPIALGALSFPHTHHGAGTGFVVRRTFGAVKETLALILTAKGLGAVLIGGYDALTLHKRTSTAFLASERLLAIVIGCHDTHTVDSAACTLFVTNECVFTVFIRPSNARAILVCTETLFVTRECVPTGCWREIVALFHEIVADRIGQSRQLKTKKTFVDVFRLVRTNLLQGIARFKNTHEHAHRLGLIGPDTHRQLPTNGLTSLRLRGACIGGGRSCVGTIFSLTGGRGKRIIC
jgi:hypothetical protein